MKKITQERVKELFDYHKDGHLIWKVQFSNRVKKNTIAGSFNGTYYQICIDNKKYLLHQVIFLWHYGYIPENDIDHIDRNMLNNKVDNFREAGRSCNIRNRGLSKNNSSSIKGVYWNKDRNKWCAQISINYKTKNLGGFIDFEEAVCVRLAVEQCLGWDICDNKSTAYQYIQRELKNENNIS